MKSTFFTSLLSCLILFSACKNKPKAIESERTLTPKLEKKWETDSLLTTCEAVLYDKTSSVIYVANVNNNPWEKDENGFISKIDTLGNIIDLKWIEGLNGPKGMGIYKGKLYVNDIDKITVIDINKNKIVKSYLVEGDPQLNDITVAKDGTVYSSGSKSNIIYSLKNDKLEVVVNGGFDRLNGLLYNPEGLFYIESNSHQFGLYNLNDKTNTVLTKEIGHGDGIIRLKNKDFIVSNWKGEIYYIKASDWSKQLILDTKNKNINAADIDFIPELNMLLVPTFFNNRIVSYKLNYVTN